MLVLVTHSAEPRGALPQRRRMPGDASSRSDAWSARSSCAASPTTGARTRRSCSAWRWRSRCWRARSSSATRCATSLRRSPSARIGRTDAEASARALRGLASGSSPARRATVRGPPRSRCAARRPSRRPAGAPSPVGRWGVDAALLGLPRAEPPRSVEREALLSPALAEELGSGPGDACWCAPSGAPTFPAARSSAVATIPSRALRLASRPWCRAASGEFSLRPRQGEARAFVPLSAPGGASASRAASTWSWRGVDPRHSGAGARDRARRGPLPRRRGPAPAGLAGGGGPRSRRRARWWTTTWPGARRTSPGARACA